jgi:predicted dehydrogenase
MTKKLRAVVVGAGDMGLRHAEGWRNLAKVTGGSIEGELVGLVDDVPARLQAVQQQYGLSSAALFNDYKTAIEQTRPDVVSVCVPTAFHAPVGLYAIEHGAHALVEKPLSLSLADADALIDAAQRQGVLLATGFMLRYSPAIETLKSWVASGKLGRPILYTSENFMEVRPKILMHHKNINGGPLLDFWCHQFDLWSLLFESEPVSVAGYGAIFAEGKPEVANLPELAIDTAGVIVRYKSGDIGQLSTSWGLPRNLSVGMVSSDKLAGPNGIILGDIRKTLTLHAMGANGQEEVLIAENKLTGFWQAEIVGFAQAIVGGGTVRADGIKGRDALKVSLAALRAIETGETVYF